MSEEQKTDIYTIFNGIKNNGGLDYVACWYKKAAEYMQANRHIRTALVSTNSITQGEQATTLWKTIFNLGVEIDFAYRTFRWDSESNDKAKVHCIIIGFSLSGSLKQAFNPACHCEPEQSSGVAIHSMTQSLSNADRRCNDTALSLSGSLKTSMQMPTTPTALVQRLTAFHWIATILLRKISQ